MSSNKPQQYSNVVLRLQANRRDQWQMHLRVSSWNKASAPTLDVQSPGLWLPDVFPVSGVDTAKDLILRLVSEQQLPYA